MHRCERLAVPITCTGITFIDQLHSEIFKYEQPSFQTEKQILNNPSNNFELKIQQHLLVILFLR